MCRDYKMARLSVHNDDIIKVMKTIIKKIDKNQLDTEIIAEAGEILEKRRTCGVSNGDGVWIRSQCTE